MSESTSNSYYDWQIQTLMLAHDLVDPISRDDSQTAEQRREQVEEELREMVMALLPESIKQNPQQDFPPELIMAITRATLAKACSIANIKVV